MFEQTKKVVIIKAGETFSALGERRGDFHDWIRAGMGLPGEGLRVVRVYAGEPLPAYDGISGIVITGSHDMVTHRLKWSERTAGWIPEAVERGIPFLGICYGHQLLAHAMGGEVEDNPNGAEIGTVDVDLSPAAETDLLFKGMPSSMKLHACHSQSVLKLPPGAVLLARSAMDPHHAFSLGQNTWGVQFHPEFDAHIMAAYIHFCEHDLRKAGADPHGLVKECIDTSFGSVILRRFAEIVHRRKKMVGCQ